MKLLHVIASMDPRTGGPCQGIRNLAPRAEEEGCSVEVVCLDDPAANYLAQENMVVHALGQGRGSWSYHPALRPWLEQNLPRFDAVILNGLWQYPGYVMSRLARRPGAPPYFVFPHGMLDPWFQRAPERRWKAWRNWVYWKLIEQHVIHRAAAVFFTCAEELRLARETFRPYQPQRQINVGYGISQAPEYDPTMATAFAQKCPGLDGRPYFLFLGRIHPKKGVDLMIKAYSAVYGGAEVRSQKSEVGNQIFPASTDSQLSTFNSQPCLVIAGPGLDTPYGKEMQRLAAELGLMAEEPQDDGRRTTRPEVGDPKSAVGSQTGSASYQPSTINHQPSVFFPGMLTGDAKWGALYGAETFVLTSHQENFGIAVAEALACGKPVLISNQINIWREIEADKAGLVVDDTLAGAEQAFQRWENLSPDEKAMMARSAKSSYENRFGIANVAKNLMMTMEKLVSEVRPLRTSDD